MTAGRDCPFAEHADSSRWPTWRSLPRAAVGLGLELAVPATFGRARLKKFASPTTGHWVLPTSQAVQKRRPVSKASGRAGRAPGQGNDLGVRTPCSLFFRARASISFE